MRRNDELGAREAAQQGRHQFALKAWVKVILWLVEQYAKVLANRRFQVDLPRNLNDRREPSRGLVDDEVTRIGLQHDIGHAHFQPVEANRIGQ